MHRHADLIRASQVSLLQLELPTAGAVAAASLSVTRRGAALAAPYTNEVDTFISELSREKVAE